MSQRILGQPGHQSKICSHKTRKRRKREKKRKEEPGEERVDKGTREKREKIQGERAPLWVPSIYLPFLFPEEECGAEQGVCG